MKNFIKAILFQIKTEGLKGFFVTGNSLGIFSKNSHFKNGSPKITYSEKSAKKAAEKMSEKYKDTFVFYKCAFCDFYHVGKNKK